MFLCGIYCVYLCEYVCVCVCVYYMYVHFLLVFSKTLSTNNLLCFILVI